MYILVQQFNKQNTKCANFDLYNICLYGVVYDLLYKWSFCIKNPVTAKCYCRGNLLRYTSRCCFPLVFKGFLWIPMDPYGFLRIPKDSHGFLWIPMDSQGFQWIPMDSYGFLRTPKDSHGLLWIPMVF
jgi:hypothetical protein